MTVVKSPVDGGGYVAHDCGDGWSVIRNVPTLANVKKGEKNAPQDIGAEWFNDVKKFHDEAYSKGKIAFPVHKNHHDDAGSVSPEFLGFFKPSSVGKLTLPEKGEVDVIFSDLKLKNSAVAEISKGHLPYLSPEIRSWNRKKISSIALMDSTPPHNEFPMLTLSEVVNDPAAKFEAELPAECAIAKFSSGFERISWDPTDPKDETKVKQEEKKPMADEKKPIQDEQSGKPSAAPVEQAKPGRPVSEIPAVKMQEDPAQAARFAAMEDANAALKARLDARDASDKAAALAAKAVDSLKGYQIGDRARAQIAKFASEGEDRLNAFVETLKEVSAKDSPRTFAAAEAGNAQVAINDPALAKFAQAGPDKLEAAAKFASEYRTLKGHPAGRGMQITEDAYVKFNMDAQESGDQTHWGINLGFGK